MSTSQHESRGQMSVLHATDKSCHMCVYVHSSALQPHLFSEAWLSPFCIPGTVPEVGMVQVGSLRGVGY